MTTQILGNVFENYEEIDSTQTEIHRRIEKCKIQNGTIIMANRQTNGKGTHGRVWHTGNENNIAFSFYIETECEPQKLEGITIEIAQILIQIFEEKYGISVQKNLNDQEIGKIMSNATYAILPIKPNVSYNNATLKTATMVGAIPIGNFSKEIKKENKVFYLNVDNYDEDSFFNILKDTQDIKEEDLKNMQEKSVEFGKKYNISNIAKSIYDVYLENIKEKR